MPTDDNLTDMRPVDAITLSQAARILGVARSTVQEWVRAGILPVHEEPGEKRRLSQAEVEQLACIVFGSVALADRVAWLYGRRLGSDGERELLKRDSQPVVFRCIGGDVVVVASEVLDEGVAGGKVPG